MNEGVWAGVRVFIIGKENRVLMVKHRQEEQGKIEGFWKVINQGRFNHQVWRKWNSRGFGIE